MNNCYTNPNNSAYVNNAHLNFAYKPRFAHRRAADGTLLAPTPTRATTTTATPKPTPTRTVEAPTPEKKPNTAQTTSDAQLAAMLATQFALEDAAANDLFALTADNINYSPYTTPSPLPTPSPFPNPNPNNTSAFTPVSESIHAAAQINSALERAHQMQANGIDPEDNLCKNWYLPRLTRPNGLTTHKKLNNTYRRTSSSLPKSPK